MEQENIKVQKPNDSKLEHPKICCFDLDLEVTNSLDLLGYKIYKGSMGSVLKVPNKNRTDSVSLALDYDIPSNLHEYDIAILDLTNEKIKDYDPKDHQNFITKNKEHYNILCSYPTTLFDPRPITSSVLKREFDEFRNRKFLQIIFACASYELEYEIYKVHAGSYEEVPSEKHNIYDFTNNLILSKLRVGNEVNVCEIRKEFAAFLSKHQKNFTYKQTFSHPQSYNSETKNYESDTNFIPFLKNSNNEIVSFGWYSFNLTTFVFPDVTNKPEFISELFKNILPLIFPDFFPFSTQFLWKNEADYFLPNHSELLKEKKEIKKEFERKDMEINERISHNDSAFNFLHDLISETGEKLVNAVYKFLLWLEFKSVIIQDEKSISVLEEDIQVELEKGLLIIETKGIGGTSTDNDCSQISKIKHRRCKERKAFDVFALYIVNHQRYQPPLSRRNPPFSDHQITDAVNDERGLLTTWQLFNLYSDIRSGLITKEDARNSLTDFGLVEFKPKTGFKLNEPKEVFNNGHVVILELENIKLKIGQTLIAEKNKKYFKITIESIQLNDKSVNEVENGEVGLKLDAPISKNTKIWTL